MNPTAHPPEEDDLSWRQLGLLHLLIAALALVAGLLMVAEWYGWVRLPILFWAAYFVLTLGAPLRLISRWMGALDTLPQGDSSSEH